MSAPQLEFYPQSATFRLYPDDVLRMEHGALSFRIDPGDFRNADIFNCRSSSARWPELDEQQFFEMRQYVLMNIQIDPPTFADDLPGKLGQCLVAMDGADALDGVESLRRLLKLAEVYR